MAISIPNLSVDDIYLDTENIDAYVKKIKMYLNNINNDLVELKKIYAQFADDPKTKGKMKNQAIKIVENCSKYTKKNDQVRATIEKLLSKSASEYALALSAFDELDALADDLGNE